MISRVGGGSPFPPIVFELAMVPEVMQVDTPPHRSVERVGYLEAIELFALALIECEMRRMSLVTQADLGRESV
jgi:hypothetical protein